MHNGVVFYTYSYNVAYLVVLLPGAGSAFVDNFAREKRVLAGIHFGVLWLLRESLKCHSVCKKEKI